MDKRLLTITWLCLIGSASADTCSPELHLSGSSPDGRYTLNMNLLAPDGMRLLEHWHYAWQDMKTGERIEGELKELCNHTHLEVFLTNDSRIGILEIASSWPTDRLLIFDRHGKLIRRFTHRDLCTYEEILKARRTTSHMGWLTIEKEKGIVPRLDGSTLLFESTTGRTIRVSLLLPPEDPRIAQRRKERKKQEFRQHGEIRDLGGGIFQFTIPVDIDSPVPHDEIPARDDDFIQVTWMRDVREYLEAENRYPFGDDEIAKLHAESICRDCELCGYLSNGKLTPAGFQLLVRKPAPEPPAAPPAPVRPVVEPPVVRLAKDESPLERWPLLVLVVGGFAAVYLSARWG